MLDCTTEMAKEIVVAHARDVQLGKRIYHYLLSGLVSVLSGRPGSTTTRPTLSSPPHFMKSEGEVGAVLHQAGSFPAKHGKPKGGAKPTTANAEPEARQAKRQTKGAPGK